MERRLTIAAAGSKSLPAEELAWLYAEPVQGTPGEVDGDGKVGGFQVNASVTRRR